MAFGCVIKKSADFSQIIKTGKSFANPLMVIYVKEDMTGYGICAGKKLGNAVKRNRVKRRIREIVRYYFPYISAKNAFVIVARASSVYADFSHMKESLCSLLKKSSLLG